MGMVNRRRAEDFAGFEGWLDVCEGGARLKIC